MEQQDIIVKATSEQSKNFIDIQFGEKSAKDRYYKQLKDKEKECTENHIAFCYPCAKMDFEDEVRRAQSELTRTPFTREEKDNKEKKVPLNLKPLDDYAKPSFFTLVDEKVQKEVTVVDGTKMSRPAYKEFNYKCKVRKHGVSIHIPWYEWEEKQKTVKK